MVAVVRCAPSESQPHCLLPSRERFLRRSLTDLSAQRNRWDRVFCATDGDRVIWSSAGRLGHNVGQPAARLDAEYEHDGYHHHHQRHADYSR